MELVGLDQVEWDKYIHAYGFATDVPHSLRAMATSTNRKDFTNALWGSLNGIFHQESIYPATPKTIPFYLQMLAGGFYPDELLHILILLLESATTTLNYRGRRTFGAFVHVIDTYRAIREGVPAYLHILDHPDPATRILSARLLGMLVDAAAESRPELEKRIDSETESNVRAQIIESFSRLFPFAMEGEMKVYRDGWTRKFDDLVKSDAPRIVQLAAAVAWTRMFQPVFSFDATMGPRVRPLYIIRMLVDGIRDPIQWADEVMKETIQFTYKDYIITDLCRLGAGGLIDVLSMVDEPQLAHEIGRELLKTTFYPRSVHNPYHASDTVVGEWYPFEFERWKQPGQYRFDQFRFHSICN